MSRLLPFALAPLVCLGAFLVREDAPEQAVRREVLDPGTAGVLRRVELTLAGGGVTTFDRFLDPPRGAPYDTPPFYSAALAVVAERLLARGDGPQELGGVDERSIEQMLGHVSPVLGGLTALAVFLLVISVLGEGGGLAALLASLLFAFSPDAIAAQPAGLLGVHGPTALLGVLVLTIAAQAGRARDGLDLLQAGMGGGIVAGLAMIISPSALWLVPLVWLAFWRLATTSANSHSVGAGLDIASGAHRAGLFLCLVGGVVTSFAVNGLPGEAGATWVRAAPELCFFSGLPFVYLLLRSDGAGSRPAFKLALWTVFVAGACLLPFSLSSVLRALWPHLLEAMSGLESALGTRMGIAWPWIVALTVGWVPAFKCGAGLQRDLWWLSVLLTGATILVPALAPVALACTCAALGVVWQRWREQSGSRLEYLAAASVIALLAWPVSGRYASRPPAASESVASALRWMRGGTPSPGPWNVPEARPSYSVLAPGELGALVRYHARRPAIACGETGVPRSAGLWACSALAQQDPGELAGLMRAAQARYLIAGAQACRQWPAVESAQGKELELKNSVLWQLTTATPGGAPMPFEEVYRSSVSSALQAPAEVEVPEVVIYRLIPSPQENRTAPYLKAR